MGKVQARLGQALGQGLDKKQGSGKVWAGKVRARPGQKARFGQGRGKLAWFLLALLGARKAKRRERRAEPSKGKLAAIPMYFTLITPPSLSPAYITNPSLYHNLFIDIYSPISSKKIKRCRGVREIAKKMKDRIDRQDRGLFVRTLPEPCPNLAPTLPQPCVGEVSNLFQKIYKHEP